MQTLFGPNRQSIRLSGYDYTSQGIYFVTICIQDRLLLFGNITDEKMHLSSPGKMVQCAWQQIVTYDPRISLDEFQIMPDHFHGIVVIGPDLLGSERNGGQGQCPAPTISLPSIIRRFKSWTTNQYHRSVTDKGWPPIGRRLWHRNYYEHIIRNDADLHRIRQYILDNPKNWDGE